jgi:hypothetical protein
MDSNLRLHHQVFCSIVLSLVLLSFGFQANAQSEAYRRQVKFETDRANDFVRFQRDNDAYNNERMKAVPAHKAKREQEEKIYETARKEYVVIKQKEDAKKPTDEFIERMLAQEEAKQEKLKEQTRKEYKAIQQEIERAIATTRLDEKKEYQLD